MNSLAYKRVFNIHVKMATVGEGKVYGRVLVLTNTIVELVLRFKRLSLKKCKFLLIFIRKIFTPFSH